MLGARSGPAPSEWQRAIVVVSNGRLLTQREMDYWTFYAQREADPSRSGVASYDGYVSFDVATGGGIDLEHEIRPLAAGRIVQPLSVDYPNFAINGNGTFSVTLQVFLFFPNSGSQTPRVIAGPVTSGKSRFPVGFASPPR